MVLRVAPTHLHATWCCNKLQKPRYRRSHPRGIKANKLYTECPSTRYTNMSTLHSTSENKPVTGDLDSTHHQMVRTVLVSCHSVAFTQRRHLLEKHTVRPKASGQPKRPRCAWCHRTDNASKIGETHATKQSIGTTHVTRLANPQRTSRYDDEGLLRRSTNADKITMVAWRIEPAFLAHMESRTTGILETKTRNTYDVPTDLTSDAQCGMCPQTSLNVDDRQTLTKENLCQPFEMHHRTQHQTARPHSAAKMTAETKATESEHDTLRAFSTNDHTSSKRIRNKCFAFCFATCQS